MTRNNVADLRSALRTGAIAVLICVIMQIAEAAYINAPGHSTNSLGLDSHLWPGRVANFLDTAYAVFMVISDPTIILPVGSPPPSFANALKFLHDRTPYVAVQYFFTGFFFWYARNRSPWYIIPMIISYFGIILTLAATQAVNIH